MSKIKRVLFNITNNRIIVVLVISFSIFIISIILLFTREKSSLNKEYTELIAHSLSIQTEVDTTNFKKKIDETSNYLSNSIYMLSKSGSDNPYELFSDFNKKTDNYPIRYISSDEIQRDGLSSLVRSESPSAISRFDKWPTVLSDIYYNDHLKSEAIDIIIPVKINNAISFAVSTPIDIGSTISNTYETATYKNVINLIIDEDGQVRFSTKSPSQSVSNNLYSFLLSTGANETEIAQIKQIVQTNKIDNTSYIRGNQTHFVSSVPLSYNNWRLVSFALSPDVLLGTEGAFHDIVRISSIAVLITVISFGFILIQLIFHRRKLTVQKSHNDTLSKKLTAMFDQHSVINLIVDIDSNTILEANDAACRYFRIDRADFVGRKVSDFNLLSTELVYHNFSQTNNGNITVNSAPHRLADGSIRFLDIYSSIITDNSTSFIYMILFDVTDRVQYKEDLIREKEYLQTTLQSIADGVVTTDISGTITGINLAGEQLIGSSSKDILKKSFSDVFILRNEKTGAIEENAIQKVLDTNSPVALSYNKVLVNTQGITIPIADSAAPIKNNDGKTTGVVMIFRNIASEKGQHARIRFLSYYDSLTGLFNRYYFEKILTKMDEAPQPVTVMTIDVNGLNMTNNIFGHKIGDKLLKEVAKLIKNHSKDEDLVARWGGDEFVILMPTTSIEEAEQIAQKIKNNKIILKETNLPLSISLGCATSTGEKGSVTEALKQAEKNMSQQKLLSINSYRNTIISSLLATLYENSTETEEHSKRMEKYCHAIGEKLHLPLKSLDELSLLALLHDIGKVAINPSILKKNGPLTDEEWIEMKKHPEIGYRIVSESQDLSEIAPLVLSHHERWDGKGYPQGLKEEEIPLPCRILSLVDAYDAMTNDRVYRKAMSKEHAIQEMQKEAGRQFDPLITKIFIDILENE